MNKLVVSNLVHRPLRSLISVVAVAVEVTLILLVVGLLVGMLNDSKQRQAGIGADIMVQPPGSSFFSSVSGAPTSIKLVERLRDKPHVVVVAPVIQQLNTTGTVEVISGIDLATYEALGGPFRFLAGGPFRGPNEVIVDEYFARDNYVQVGDNLDTLNHSVRICGIVQQGKGARTFLASPLTAAASAVTGVVTDVRTLL